MRTRADTPPPATTVTGWGSPASSSRAADQRADSEHRAVVGPAGDVRLARQQDEHLVRVSPGLGERHPGEHDEPVGVRCERRQVVRAVPGEQADPGERGHVWTRAPHHAALRSTARSAGGTGTTTSTSPSPMNVARASGRRARRKRMARSLSAWTRARTSPTPD